MGPILIFLALSSAHAITGDTVCSPGEIDCNRCVVNVEKQFRELPDLPTSRSHLYYGRWETLPPYNTYIRHLGLRSHIQGYSRLNGSEPWITMTRSEPGDLNGAGFFLLNGEHRYYYPVHGLDHSGGLQVFGGMLAFGNECSSSKCQHTHAWVDFFDVTDPAHARQVNRLVMDGSRGEPGQDPADPNASFTAVVKLTDGRHLVLVGGARSETAWLYVSDRPGLSAATRWKYVRFYEKIPGWNGFYQNMNFVTECGTGQVYLVGMGRVHLQRLMHLFTVDDYGAPHRVAVKKLDWKALRACNPRGGAGIHVTDTGGFELYCASKIGAPFRGMVRNSVYTRRN